MCPCLHAWNSTSVGSFPMVAHVCRDILEAHAATGNDAELERIADVYQQRVRDERGSEPMHGVVWREEPTGMAGGV